MMASPLKKTELSTSNRLARLVWGLVWHMFFRPSPRITHGWRRALLRLFGARLGRGVHVYPSARVWAPWNLEMGDGACLADDVDCYSVARVKVGARTTVSQYSYLCTASHDHARRDMPLVTSPIVLGDDVWITADVFVGPGVTIGDGAVVLARSSVVRDLPAWMVCAGTPARPLRRREIDDAGRSA
jgi:putative colanic acid biosynthesis acetyltransferase WcaF